MSGIPVIVCSGEKGRKVVYGRCDHVPVVGESVVISGAKMILRWERIGLFGVAGKGPAAGCRITSAVPQTEPGPATEVIEVTEEAARAIEAWPDAE